MIQQSDSAASLLEAVFTGVKLVYPWGRYFLSVCQKCFISFCKGKKFQAFRLGKERCSHHAD
jgi:hypothetical protein